MGVEPWNKETSSWFLLKFQCNFGLVIDRTLSFRFIDTYRYSLVFSRICEMVHVTMASIGSAKLQNCCNAKHARQGADGADQWQSR